MQQNYYQTNHRQLYMLPTKAGWVYGLVVFALLLAALKYNHQATFLLTFLLAAIGQVTSLYTHKNLLKIGIQSLPAEPVFAGDKATFPIELKNPSTSQRHGIWTLCGDFKHCSSLAPSHTATININIPAKQRGLMNMPAIILSSQFPIGILFSWTKLFKPDTTCLIYPEPKNILPSPELKHDDTEDEEENNTKQVQGSDEFSSLRHYVPGDRLRDIHWPALAKNNQLVSKEYKTTARSSLIFDWQHVHALSTEDKLSQLTYWILQAEKQQQDYQLSIPGFTSEHTQGLQHRHSCLQQLAQWQG